MTKRNYDSLLIENHELRKKLEFYEKEISEIKRLITTLVKEGGKEYDAST